MENTSQLNPESDPRKVRKNLDETKLRIENLLTNLQLNEDRSVREAKEKKDQGNSAKKKPER